MTRLTILLTNAFVSSVLFLAACSQAVGESEYSAQDQLSGDKDASDSGAAVDVPPVDEDQSAIDALCRGPRLSATLPNVPPPDPRCYTSDGQIAPCGAPCSDTADAGPGDCLPGDVCACDWVGACVAITP